MFISHNLIISPIVPQLSRIINSPGYTGKSKIRKPYTPAGGTAHALSEQGRDLKNGLNFENQKIRNKHIRDMATAPGLLHPRPRTNSYEKSLQYMTYSTLTIYGLFGFLAVGIILVAARKTARRIRNNIRKGLDACWSIGYRRALNPFEFDFADSIPTFSRLQIREPVQTVADPFLIRSDDNRLYLFHEVVYKTADRGKIAVSIFDPENNRWEYQGVVLDEPFHLSYPYVFYADGGYYMIPESKAAKSVRLYTATEFPMKWELVKPIIINQKLVDPSIVYFNGRYYLFANRKKRLYLYYSSSLTGQWTLHPKSPVRRGNYARCGGRIFQYNSELFRPAQNLAKGYGTSMRFFKITKLSDKQFAEKTVGKTDFLRPFLHTWARFGMHHFDVVKFSENDYFTVFDGKGVPVAQQFPQNKDSKPPVNQACFYK